LSAGFAVRAAPALAVSVARADALQDRTELRFDTAPGAGWHNCAEFLRAPHALDEWRAELAGWLRAEYGQAPPRTAAGYVLQWYLYILAFAGAMLFHTERRVPVLHPEQVWFRRAATGRPDPDGTALATGEFACLPDDPASGTPGATEVADLAALAAVLRGRYLAHAAAFVRAYAPTVRFGQHTLWAAATDALDTSLLLAGRYAGDENAGVTDAALVLPAKITPLTSASTMCLGTDKTWTRRRESCCFHYLLPAEDACATCPRVLPKR